jgi:phosphoglycolate phosphatase
MRAELFMPYRAVIFDLDGTLLDTIEDLADSMNAALARMGHPARTLAECKLLVGDGLETYVRRALPPAAAEDPRERTRLQELMSKEYAERNSRKTRPYPGIPELLDALTIRRIPMAVLSNKPHDSTLVVVRHYFPRWRFNPVYGAREEVPVKPDPAGALEIAALLGIAPADIAYVGDTNTDMRTAAAAGMFPVGVLWGFRTAEELRANGARILLEAPLDLLAILD